MQPWSFPEGFSDSAAQEFAGFVYLITNTITGRAYIGRKFFKAKVRGKIKESDWRTYCGSCKPLKEDIALLGSDNFTRRILTLHRTKGETTFGEIAEQFRRDVLHSTLPCGDRAYYNGNIMSRWFATTEATASTRAKMSKAKTGVKRAPMSDEHKAKIASARLGKKDKITDEERKRRRKQGKKLSQHTNIETRLKGSKARTRLSEQDILAIRGCGLPLQEIMDRYGISRTHACRVRKGDGHPWL